jgi:hypothetical protein
VAEYRSWRATKRQPYPAQPLPSTRAPNQEGVGEVADHPRKDLPVERTGWQTRCSRVAMPLLSGRPVDRYASVRRALAGGNEVGVRCSAGAWAVCGEGRQLSGDLERLRRLAFNDGEASDRVLRLSFLDGFHGL